MFGANWVWLDVPIHLHHFEADRLRRLVELTGLRVRDVKFTTAGHSAEDSIQKTRFRRLYRFLNNARLARPVVRSLEQAADAARAGSGLTILAQRPL
jgi:hypothetical protein